VFFLLICGFLFKFLFENLITKREERLGNAITYGNTEGGDNSGSCNFNVSSTILGVDVVAAGIHVLFEAVYERKIIRN